MFIPVSSSVLYFFHAVSVLPRTRHSLHISSNNMILTRLAAFLHNRITMISQNTLCLKKVPKFKLSVTLPNCNRFSKFLQAGEYEICYKTHTTLPTSP